MSWQASLSDADSAPGNEPLDPGKQMITLKEGSCAARLHCMLSRRQ
jgi:hypothetical protein